MARAVVIGSGFGGLASAVRLATRGHQVTLLEQRDRPGGRAYVYQQDGYTFDGGPTVITAPWLIEDLFTNAGRNSADHLTLVPLDPFYRIFFADNTHLDYSGNTDQMIAQMTALSPHPGDPAGYLRLLEMTERIFDKGFTELADKPFLRFQDMARIAPDLIRLQSQRSVYNLVARFVKDERLRQAFSFHPLLVGGNPFQTTSIYTLIHHLEREWGVWFAKGGTGAIVDALVSLFQDLGGELHLNSPVAEILVSGRQVSGVRMEDGGVEPADLVVSNAEVATTYRSLIPAVHRKTWTDRKLAALRYSMSLVVIYFGTNRRYRGDDAPALAHHNIILGPRYEELLTDVFDRKILADDFSLYLHMPTLTDASLAPPGGEAFYVLAPVPHLGSGINWEATAKPYRDKIMQFLEENYLPNLSNHIVTERMIDPRHFATTLSSYLGAGFSLEPVLTQSAWFRPHNRSEEFDNLYFTGAGTHPGAGMPGVLTSAKIVDDLIGPA